MLRQLFHHTGKSKEELQALEARLCDLAHAYCGTPIDLTDFLMHRKCFEAMKSLRLNSDIIITKPNKGYGVVILNETDYLTKMNSILNDTSKFQNIGPVNDNDNTAEMDGKLQKWLLRLHKDGYFTESEYNKIRPTGSQRPRMYWPPKTHKSHVLLRCIILIITTAALKIFAGKTPYFLFAEEIRQLKLKPDESFLCSFDISSLLTNVPLDETRDVAAAPQTSQLGGAQANFGGPS